jgi:hypothetical protein
VVGSAHIKSQPCASGCSMSKKIGGRMSVSSRLPMVGEASRELAQTSKNVDKKVKGGGFRVVAFLVDEG